MNIQPTRPNTLFVGKKRSYRDSRHPYKKSLTNRPFNIVRSDPLQASGKETCLSG